MFRSFRILDSGDRRPQNPSTAMAATKIVKLSTAFGPQTKTAQRRGAKQKRKSLNNNLVAWDCQDACH